MFDIGFDNDVDNYTSKHKIIYLLYDCSEHMQWHIYGIECYRHLCPICGNKYRVSTKLVEHMRLHTNEKPFKCENCDEGRVRDTHAWVEIH